MSSALPPNSDVVRSGRHLTFCHEEISDHPMTSASAAEQTEGNYFREGLRRLDREELPERRLGLLRCLAYFRSEDQGKLTKFARLSKQMFPYILRYDARSTGSL